ncbi:MAG: hypothetical protein DRJ40_00195 [Thermoprotei archaeon]|nr:MAG: hypothetical protein DRJ40_00195 [Thermoprotei archaeon]
MTLHVVMYHPKNLKNIIDVAKLVSEVGGELIVVERPRATYTTTQLRNIKVIRDLGELPKQLGRDTTYIVLETYGTQYLHEVEIPKTGNIAIVVGAEDYGIPREEVGKLPRAKVVKIPCRVQGMSYNVVTVVAMALYEVMRQRKSD